MQGTSRYATAVLTLLIAFGSGHVVQNRDRLFGGPAEKVATVRAPIAPAVAPATTAPDLLLPADPALPAVLGDGARGPVPAPGAPNAPALPGEMPAPVFQAAGCDSRLQAGAMPGALVRLEIAAPCHGGQTVRVSHAGLAFVQALDAAGDLALVVPVMDAAGRFVVEPGDGTSLAAAAAVADFDAVFRVAIAWPGNADLNLNAVMRDAASGAPLHVRAGLDAWTDTVAAGMGSYVATFGSAAGDAPMRAQILSIAMPRHEAGPSLQFYLEAALDSPACGSAVTAVLVQPDFDASLLAAPINLQLPECDGLGGYLVLNNLLQNVKIAGN